MLTYFDNILIRLRQPNRPNQSMQPTADRPYAPLSFFWNVTCNSRGG